MESNHHLRYVELFEYSEIRDTTGKVLHTRNRMLKFFDTVRSS